MEAVNRTELGDTYTLIPACSWFINRSLVYLPAKHSAGSRRVGIIADSMLAECWNEDILRDPCNCVVMPLIHSRLHPAIGFADLNNLLDFLWTVVAEAKFLELAF